MWSETPTAKPKYATNGCPDISANQMLSNCVEKGDISSIPEIAGLLVFLQGHVGVYIGDGNVVEAKGHKYGVVKSELCKGHWTHWGRCPYLEYVDKMTGEEIM